MSHRSIRILKLLTSFSALGSLFAQSIAIFTNEWLYSEELMNNPEFKKYNMSAASEHLSKFTVSGLWILCQNEPGVKSMNCTHIDYLTDEEYTPDPNDSTMAIPYAAKKAALFMALSTGSILLGVFTCFTANKCIRRKALTFASGISFILSGLMILCSIVIYISTFKAEVGNKLRPKSSFQEATFRYKYGVSFMFCVLSLMMCEVAGTFSIFLYIRLHQLDWEKEFSQQEALVDLLQAPGPLSSSSMNTSLSPSNTINLPAPIASYCKKHGGRGRRYSRSKEISREPSPIPLPIKSSRTPSYVGINSPLQVPSPADYGDFQSSTKFPFPPPPPPPPSQLTSHFSSSSSTRNKTRPGVFIISGSSQQQQHDYNCHRESNLSQTQSSSHHHTTVSGSNDMDRESSSREDYSPPHDSICRASYPTPILEQDFSSNSEYMGDYSPTKEFPLDNLRRTTPV
ncbi:uncharacterized protein LOC107366557 [Tetranychus urticae]|uniref:Voltage-dependent calcium channel gamma-5 subunit n=1 Tax=Tetranychus urticae TaxID=32264 RepID=T1KR52_TETUR|nr:uncharacterized protein LOC107366557 [Tetranychus urticae]